MTGKSIIKSLLKEREWSKTQLADEMDIQRTNVAGYLNRGTKDMRFDIFLELCNAMGYEVVIRDKMNKNMTVMIAECDKK